MYIHIKEMYKYTCQPRMAKKHAAMGLDVE